MNRKTKVEIDDPGCELLVTMLKAGLFAVSKDAYILRSNSRLSMSGGGTAIETLRLITGKLLFVSGKTRHKMHTPNATMDVRENGIYVEAGEKQSYVCTRYGVVDLTAVNDDRSRETIASQHHDAPRYTLSGESAGNNIRSAPFIKHTVMELQIIEGLVGREPPFNMASGGYTSPRRTSS